MSLLLFVDIASAGFIYSIMGLLERLIGYDWSIGDLLGILTVIAVLVYLVALNSLPSNRFTKYLKTFGDLPVLYIGSYAWLYDTPYSDWKWITLLTIVVFLLLKGIRVFIAGHSFFIE